MVRKRPRCGGCRRILFKNTKTKTISHTHSRVRFCLNCVRWFKAQRGTGWSTPKIAFRRDGERRYHALAATASNGDTLLDRRLGKYDVVILIEALTHEYVHFWLQRHMNTWISMQFDSIANKRNDSFDGFLFYAIYNNNVDSMPSYGSIEEKP